MHECMLKVPNKYNEKSFVGTRCFSIGLANAHEKYFQNFLI